MAVLPIETKPQDSDVIALQHIVPREISGNFGFAPTEPAEVMREISKCRLVITGSYHAGVFALAMGIPVIALIASEYYVDKFYGLQMQFGNGLEMVDLSRADAAANAGETGESDVARCRAIFSRIAKSGGRADGRRRARFSGIFRTIRVIPEISVIMPVFNCGKYLAASLESISAQTIQGFRAYYC